MFHRMILLAQADIAAEGIDINSLHATGAESTPPEFAIGLFFLLFIIFWVFICIVLTVAVTIIPLWMICKKAGVSPYLSLLILVPGVNLAFHWILALIPWPNLKAEIPNQTSPPPNYGEVTHFYKEKYDRDGSASAN